VTFGIGRELMAAKILIFENEKQKNMYKPLEDEFELELPPHFAEASEKIYNLIEQCDSAQIPMDTMLAAILTELMPRLVQAYGPREVATMLSSLASEVSDSIKRPASIQ
jgi:hypothetical protein|tara:strand:- start:133 stop:459 length:327 start_codon:yes stop_codon:yes gene_type:complete